MSAGIIFPYSPPPASVVSATASIPYPTPSAASMIYSTERRPVGLGVLRHEIELRKGGELCSMKLSFGETTRRQQRKASHDKDEDDAVMPVTDISGAVRARIKAAAAAPRTQDCEKPGRG